MSNDIAVEAHGLGKCYRVFPTSWDRIVEWATRGKVQRHLPVWALEDISFSLPRGSALGVVGANGAGKSTLLKVITGTTPATHGSYKVNGRVASLLELGTGFHPNFSGAKNIYMNAAIMGISRDEVDARFGEIAEFADLGPYLNRPTRTYSSGMTMRLGFAAAMLYDPDILILDEVMAVGDASFQKKCMDRIREIRKRGASVLFVSHSVYHVRQICDQAIWIQGGKVVSAGDPEVVTDEYSNYQHALGAGKDPAELVRVAEADGGEGLGTAPQLGKAVMRWGDPTVDRIQVQTGQTVDFHLSWFNPTSDEPLHLGVIIQRNDDVQILTMRTKEAGYELRGRKGTVVMRLEMPLTSGEYTLAGYLLDESMELVIDQRLVWLRFKVSNPGPELGVFRYEPQWLSEEEAAS